MSKLVIEDFQHTVLQVAERTFNEKALSTLPTSSYEFPEGYNQVIYYDRLVNGLLENERFFYFLIFN